MICFFKKKLRNFLGFDPPLHEFPIPEYPEHSRIYFLVLVPQAGRLERFVFPV